MKNRIKSIFSAFILLSFLYQGHSQELYMRSFGNPKDKAIIFLHGGPGYNSINFEGTTAKALSENGFFVIIYDRRGEGRSEDKKANYTFKETFEDLKSIYKKYDLKKAILIGHSFGGTIATLYTENFPEMVSALILVGSPVSMQETFKAIILKSKRLYQLKSDSTNLKYIATLEKMDTSSIAYSSYCFRHAMQNGFYRTKTPTDAAMAIYNKVQADTAFTKYSNKMTIQPVQGFWKNEKYTTINLASNLHKLKENGVSIYGLYGKDDGLFSKEQVFGLKKLIGTNNVKYYDNCSHNVFVDQQIPFIEALKHWTK